MDKGSMQIHHDGYRPANPTILFAVSNRSSGTKADFGGKPAESSVIVSIKCPAFLRGESSFYSEETIPP